MGRGGRELSGGSFSREGWGIVMSRPTVTNDRTEFANCDGTQFRCLKAALHETPSGATQAITFPPSDSFRSYPSEI